AQTGDGSSNVTLKIDLPGDVNLDSMKCQSCGGVLTMDAIPGLGGLAAPCEPDYPKADAHADDPHHQPTQLALWTEGGPNEEHAKENKNGCE
ncbi:MAG TPA: hypothetical protein DEH25_18250, partial [Chloroflexi bacterium]|nr:hypothetical protein [Chloroflexota bacterium]